VTARSKLCLMQYLRDRASEKGMDRDAALAVLDCVLQEAGKDGCQMMAELLKIEPREKKKNEYGVVAEAYREPILETLRAQDAGKPELDALIMLGTIAKYVKVWGIKFRSLEPLQEHFGFDDKTIKALATAEVKAEIEAKAAKKNPSSAKAAEGKASKNSVDPTNVSVEKVNATTKAADSRAKRGMPNAECGMTNDGPSGVEKITGIQETKIGKPESWNAADVEAGAKLLKAGTHKVADLIGPKPGKGDAIKLKNWNAVRLRLLRKQGKVK
jgi:hypothetical protein